MRKRNLRIVECQRHRRSAGAQRRPLPPIAAQIATALGPALDDPSALHSLVPYMSAKGHSRPKCSPLFLRVNVCFAPEADVHLPQLENACTLRSLAEKSATQGRMPHFWRLRIKQRVREDSRQIRGIALLGRICWSRAARRTKRVYLARPRAHSGCDPEGGARAVPGRGFAHCVRAVRKLARPAKRRSARSWLPGERIGCPRP